MKISLKIHSEGYIIILIATLLVIAFCGAIQYFFSGSPLFANLFCSFFVVVLSLVVMFFRYPTRSLEKNRNIIYAPADGTIVAVEEINEKKYANESRIKISIFMSPMNMHVNFHPIDGKVILKDYFPGDKLVAWHPKSSDLNEHSIVWIENEEDPCRNVIVKQIAGAIARRIVCRAEEGQTVEQGEELGIIKLGSRVDVLLPLNARINITLNQKVRAKKTVLAYFE